MPIDFPNSPTPGQAFQVGSRKWKWSGEQWVADNAEILSVVDSPTIDLTWNAATRTLSAAVNTINSFFTGTGTQLLSSTGYQRLPGGLIIQWGIFRYTASGGADVNPVTWVYPIPFPTSVVNINITPNYNGPINGNVSGFVETIALTSALVGLDGSASFGALTNIPVYITAIGY